jgi:hypothetical protein
MMPSYEAGATTKPHRKTRRLKKPAMFGLRYSTLSVFVMAAMVSLDSCSGDVM